MAELAREGRLLQESWRVRAAPDEAEAWLKMRLALQTLHRAAGDSGRLVQPEGMALDSLLVESLELCI